MFAPAAAKGLSGGWGGDTGGAGGRAGARTGAARGNGRGAEGPRRALFTSRRQSSPGGRAAGEARPGRQFPSPSGLHPAAWAGTTGCTPLFFYSHSPRALYRRRRLLVPGGAGLRSRSAFATKQQQQKTSGLFVAPWSGARLPGPLPAELALGDLAASVVGAPRALVPTLLHRRSARGGRTHSRLQWDIFTLLAKDRKITPGAGIQPRGSFRCPSWANLLGCPQRATFPTE